MLTGEGLRESNAATCGTQDVKRSTESSRAELGKQSVELGNATGPIGPEIDQRARANEDATARLPQGPRSLQAPFQARWMQPEQAEVRLNQLRNAP